MLWRSPSVDIYGFWVHYSVIKSYTYYGQLCRIMQMVRRGLIEKSPFNSLSSHNNNINIIISNIII